EGTTEYVVSVYRGDTPVPGTDEWSALPDDERKQIYAGYQALATAEGSTPGTPVGLPGNATTVRAENGKTVVTDGPYVGIKEAIGAFFIFEGDGLEAALKLAAQAPALRYGGAVGGRPAEADWGWPRVMRRRVGPHRRPSDRLHTLPPRLSAYGGPTVRVSGSWPGRSLGSARTHPLPLHARAPCRGTR